MTSDVIDFDVVDEEFSDGISPKGLAHADVGKKLNFYAWHKPRKHWVRVNQWNVSIKKLISKLQLGATTRPLSYLSLPGPDLLDVRAIQPICVEVDVKLRFLGLNNIGEHEKEVATEQALSISEVRAMSNIDPSSSVEQDKFEHIANTKSVAYGRVIKDKASFDVVNIDLCCSFAETKPGESIPDYYNALFKLLRHQADTRVDDWLFFLTTRNNQDMTHPETINRFINSINCILNADAELKQFLIDKNIFLENDFLNGHINLDQLDSKSFANSFLLGIGKWIVDALLVNNPKWKVDTLPVYGYHVAKQSADCDMMSLGFYCSRVLEPAIDTHMLAGAAVNDTVMSLERVNKGCLDRLVNRVENQTDIDVLLYLDGNLYQECLDGSAALLRAARYHEDAYRGWAENENKKLITFLSNFGLTKKVAA